MLLFAKKVLRRNSLYVSVVVVVFVVVVVVVVVVVETVLSHNGVLFMGSKLGKWRKPLPCYRVVGG